MIGWHGADAEDQVDNVAPEHFLEELLADVVGREWKSKRDPFESKTRFQVRGTILSLANLFWKSCRSA